LRRDRIDDDLDPVSEFHTLDQFGQLVVAVDTTPLFCAPSISLKTMASGVLFDRQPFDRIVRCRTVAKVLSMGFVVRRCFRCSAGKSWNASRASRSLIRQRVAFAVKAALSAASQPGYAYVQGANDWRAYNYKAWPDVQTGDRRAGVTYWAANRNARGHLPCDEQAEEYSG